MKLLLCHNRKIINYVFQSRRTFASFLVQCFVLSVHNVRLQQIAHRISIVLICRAFYSPCLNSTECGGKNKINTMIAGEKGETRRETQFNVINQSASQYSCYGTENENIESFLHVFILSGNLVAVVAGRAHTPRQSCLKLNVRVRALSMTVYHIHNFISICSECFFLMGFMCLSVQCAAMSNRTHHTTTRCLAMQSSCLSLSLSHPVCNAPCRVPVSRYGPCFFLHKTSKTRKQFNSIHYDAFVTVLVSVRSNTSIFDYWFMY